jgi:hypothetical protein
MLEWRPFCRLADRRGNAQSTPCRKVGHRRALTARMSSSLARALVLADRSSLPNAHYTEARQMLAITSALPARRPGRFGKPGESSLGPGHPLYGFRWARRAPDEVYLLRVLRAVPASSALLGTFPGSSLVTTIAEFAISITPSGPYRSITDQGQTVTLASCSTNGYEGGGRVFWSLRPLAGGARAGGW